MVPASFGLKAHACREHLTAPGGRPVILYRLYGTVKRPLACQDEPPSLTHANHEYLLPVVVYSARNRRWPVGSMGMPDLPRFRTLGQDRDTAPAVSEDRMPTLQQWSDKAMTQPKDTIMSDSDAVLAARAALGSQLAALRKRAGHTQHRFAGLLNGYSRSTLANAETGYQHIRRDFWEQCDTTLATGGVLARGFDDIEAAMRDDQKLAAQRAQAEREDRIRQQRAVAKSEARSLLERISSRQTDGTGETAHGPGVPLDLPAPPPGTNGRPVDQSYVEWVRSAVQQLVVMDNQHGGDDIASLAVRTFRSVHHRLGTGAYQPKIEQDLQAAAAELAEVAGWLLYDANRHTAARQLNHEALFYARLAGDLNMERLTLQNMSTQAVKLHRPTEGLALARQLLDTNPLSPRLQSLFRIREARALADCGYARDALASFARARTLFLDGVPDDDPPWAWWITDRLLSIQEGMCYASLGKWGRAIDLSQVAVEATPTTQPRDRYYNSAHLLRALVQARAWEDAESLLPDILSYAYNVGSGRTAALLFEIIPAVLASKATPELREGARHLREVLEGLGYEEG